VKKLKCFDVDFFFFFLEIEVNSNKAKPALLSNKALLGFCSLVYSILNNHHNLRNLHIEFYIFFSKKFIDDVFLLEQ
jgi:hypothetical protein